MMGHSAETEVRLIRPDDADGLAQALEVSRDAHSRWQPWREPQYYTVEGQRKAIERALDSHAVGTSWPGVIVTNAEDVIGQITVSAIMRFPFQRGFLGYWVSARHGSTGHASRAVGIMLDIMRDELGLFRVEAHTQLDNWASQKVLRRNGFTPFGMASEHIFIDGDWRDDLFWQRVVRDGPLRQPGDSSADG